MRRVESRCLRVVGHLSEKCLVFVLRRCLRHCGGRTAVCGFVSKPYIQSQQ